MRKNVGRAMQGSDIVGRGQKHSHEPVCMGRAFSYLCCKKCMQTAQTYVHSVNGFISPIASFTNPIRFLCLELRVVKNG